MAPILTWLLKLALFSLIFNTFRPLTYVRRLVYFGLIVSGAFYITHSTVNGVSCGPRGGTDREAFLAGTTAHMCTDRAGMIAFFGVLSGIMNFLIDLYLLIIPLRATSKLKHRRKQKTYVFVIFLAGVR